MINKLFIVLLKEPHDNGPLFVEMHFYKRNAKLEDIRSFQKERGLKSLGMPYMIGNGSAEINGVKHRFIVMPRYGSDVAKHFLANGRKIPEGTCYRLALQMLDVYEYIHSCGYVHADLKAANILLGYGKQQQHQAYLVDFGLASHYTTKDFKPDPKKMHNGTIEYTSRDAHHGVPTMRADLEILGYNLIEWLGADLPWVRDKILTSPSKVQKAKEEFMANVATNLKKLFPTVVPMALLEFFKYVAKMKFNDTPDYEMCRKIFTTTLKNLKVPMTGDLNFKFKTTNLNNNINSPSTSRAAKIISKKIIKKENSASEAESEEEVINASDDDDDDVVFLNHKKTLKSETKRPLKNSVKLTPKQRVLENSSLKRAQSDSPHESESSPSPAKRNRLNATKSPPKTRTSPLKSKTPQKSSSSPLTSSAAKSRNSPLHAKANIRMSPAITMPSSSLRSGKTIINDRVTPNRKPTKIYEFNFELDVSMDANVVVNVKRKKKPLQLSQEEQSSSLRNTPSGKTSNSSPVTRVKVHKVGSDDMGTDSPRTPAVTVKKSKRLQQTPS